MREATKRHFAEVKALPEPTPDATAPRGRVRVIVLASGSQGNSILISHGERAVLIDAGITESEIRDRCRSVGHTLAQLDAVLLTHWHKDHNKFVLEICQKYHCPLVCSKTSLLAMESKPFAHRRANPGEEVEVGDWIIYPIRTDHEEGSLAYHVRVAGKNIVVAHDLGQPSSTLLAAARAADALLIEANYDADLLHGCANPNHTQQLHERVESIERGHLSNIGCSEVVSHVDPERIQVICGLHLSSSHNTEVLAEESIRAGLPPTARPAIYLGRQHSAVLLEVNGGPTKIELPLIDQFRKLDRQVDAIIAEQKRSDAETAERRVVIGEHLAAMRELFAQKEPEDMLDGHQFFDHWKDSKAEAYGISPRMMEYYLLDTETVVPIIGREAAIALPLGTISELGKLAKAKGKIAPEVLEYAQQHSAREVKAHVAAILYPGKTGHFDGPEDHLTITTGKAQVQHLRTQLEKARKFVSPEASDAEVIEFALEEFLQEHSKSPDTVLEAVVVTDDIPLPPDFDDFEFNLQESANEQTA